MGGDIVEQGEGLLRPSLGDLTEQAVLGQAADDVVAALTDRVDAGPAEHIEGLGPCLLYTTRCVEETGIRHPGVV